MTKKIKKIVGIDYSMTCPAMCLLHEGASFSNSHFYFLSDRKRDVPWGRVSCEPHKEYSTEIERFDNIANYFVDKLIVARDFDTKEIVVYLEDYSMGSKGRVFHIAENTAILKYKLWKAGIPVKTVPPTVLKKYATGKGNADKQMMFLTFRALGNPDITRMYYDKLNVKIGSPVSDIVDAYFLALYGNNEENK